MKTKIILWLFPLLLLGCTSDEETFTSNVTQQHTADTQRQSQTPGHTVASQNKVLLLKVDFLTHAFEGGKQLVFKETPGFTIGYNYQPPGDFGSIALLYTETAQPIFEGTIIWMGLGQMQYPQSLNPAAAFSAFPNPLPMPPADAFDILYYDPSAYYPDPVPLASIWNAVDNLQIVAQYRHNNPGAAIRIFLYTPSVGVGDPADWDYFVILKN